MSDTYSSLPMNISGADGCDGGGRSGWLKCSEISSAQTVSYRSILDNEMRVLLG